MTTDIKMGRIGMKFAPKAALLCATAIGYGLAVPAIAQSTTPPASPEAAREPAAAPADPEPAANEIIVTGFRASLEKGLEIKRASTALVDSIVAEDIGKFPTQNIAEALQRIPGVDLVRNGESNEGNRIQLRGLGPEFTLTTFNGAPVRTTSSSNIGASTRDFNYDIFSSELFGRADVYKTPLAELEEGGVAGVVNLRTPRPFDRPGLKVAYSAQANYGELAKKWVPRGALQVSNTWGNFGIALGIATSGNKNRRFGYEPTGSFNNEFENLLYTPDSNFNSARLASLTNIAAANSSYTFSTPCGAAATLTAPCINSTTGGLTLPSTPNPFFNTGGINTFRIDFADPAANLNGLTQAALRNALVPRLLRITGTENDRKRYGASGSIQYKDDRADVSFDLLFAQLKDDYQRQILGFAPRNSLLASGGGVAPGVGLASIPQTGGNQPAWVPIAPTIDANGLLGGTFRNVSLQNASTYRRSDTEFLSMSLNGRFKFTDRFSVEGQLGRTNSKADAVNVTAILNGINPLLAPACPAAPAVCSSAILAAQATAAAQNRGSLSQITFSVSDPFNPSLSTTSNLNSPLLYNQLQLSANQRIERDVQKNARLIFELNFDNLASFEAKFRVGGSYVDSVKQTTQPNIGNGVSCATTAGLANPLNSVNIGTGGATLRYCDATEAQRTAYIQSIITPIALAGTPQAGVPTSWLALNRPYIDQLGIDEAARASPVDLNSSFKATERVTAFFGQVDLKSDWGLRANIGMRYVKTRTIIQNFVTRTTPAIPASGGNPAVPASSVTLPQTTNGGYENWLPSISFAYNITPKLIVRGLYSRTVTRSSLNNIARAFSIPNSGTQFLTAGNPDLKPQRSSGFDGAIEWYFNRGGILSLSYYSKIIKDRPLQINETVKFGDLGLDSSLFTSPLNTGSGVDPNTDFTVARFVNQERYTVRGIEAAYQQSFRFLPKPFDGLGAIASVNYIPTKTAPWFATNDPQRLRPYNLQGIPKYTASGTIYYEKGPLSVRGSYTYRSEQFTGNQNTNGLDFQQFNNPRSYLDASISYKFFKWLEVRIDGQNLTNTKTFEFSRSLTGQFGDETVRADQAFQNGRVFTFGIRGSF